MKKLIMFGVLLVMAIFGMTTSDCIAEEETSPSVTIIMEDGNLYEMTAGDNAQWEFFISSNKEIKIEEVLIVFSTLENKDVRAVANVKIVEGGRQSDVLGYTDGGSLPVIKNVIVAVQDAIIHRN